MTDLVLIPGAWLGAWAWRDVTPHLERAGHTAHPVTLTGMGDRAHLLTKDVGMESAIQDVLNVIKFNEIGEFILVGHSFAGKIAAAVADRTASSVKKVIYLDSFRPERVTEPQGGFDPTREFGAQPPGSLAVPLSDKTIDAIGPDVQGNVRARLKALATPWPIRMAMDPITLTSGYAKVNETYIFCSRAGDPVDEIVAGKWGKLDGPHRIIDTGHWPMLTKPAELAKDLVALAK